LEELDKSPGVSLILSYSLSVEAYEISPNDGAAEFSLPFFSLFLFSS
jgi:hypothetical protein